MRGRSVLELGAGTAVAAMAAARLGAARVAVQELPEVLPHTERVLAANGFVDTVERVDARWGADFLPGAAQHSFDVVVMADVLYHCTDFADLITAIYVASSLESTSYVIVAFEQRRRNLDSFFAEMMAGGEEKEVASRRQAFQVKNVYKHCAKNISSGAETILYLVVMQRIVA